MRNVLPTLFASLLMCFGVSGHAAGKNQRKTGKYVNLEISTFDVKNDIEPPSDFLPQLRRELPHRLAETRKFSRVFDQGDGLADKNAPTLVMKGSLIDFTSGNRIKRYLVGFSAGAAEAVAHVKFVDSATGDTIFERDVTAKMSSGVFGGSTNAIVDQLIGEIVRVMKKETF